MYYFNNPRKHIRKQGKIYIINPAKRNGITIHAYYYWHRKVQDGQLGLMENRFVEVMVNNPLKKRKAGTADSEIIINWKDFSIFINDPQQISLLAELMQKLVRECKRFFYIRCGTDVRGEMRRDIKNINVIYFNGKSINFNEVCMSHTNFQPNQNLMKYFYKTPSHIIEYPCILSNL